MIKFEEGGWYQAYVSIYDQTAGLRDTGLRVIVEVLTIVRGRGYIKGNRLSEDGRDFISNFIIWTDLQHKYQHYDQGIVIYQPGEENNSLNEFAAIEKESAFGWPELVFFDAGYELGIDEARKRLQRPRKDKTEMMREVIRSAPQELKANKKSIVEGATHGAKWISFDEAYMRKRVLKRGSAEALFEASRKLYERLQNDKGRRNSDSNLRDDSERGNPTEH